MRLTTHFYILQRQRTSGRITPLLHYSFVVCVASCLPPPYINESYIRIDKFHSVMCTTDIANHYNHRTTQKSSKDIRKRASNLDRRSELSLCVVRNSSCNFRFNKWCSWCYPVTHVCSDQIIDTIFNPFKIFLLYSVLLNLWKNIALWSFPGFNHLSFWYVRHVDEDECGALMEWSSQGKRKY
jgi:hypothetical protein